MKRSAAERAAYLGWVLIRSSKVSESNFSPSSIEKIPRPKPLKATCSKPTPSSRAQLTESRAVARLVTQIRELSPNEVAMTELFVIALRRMPPERRE